MRVAEPDHFALQVHIDEKTITFHLGGGVVDSKDVLDGKGFVDKRHGAIVSAFPELRADVCEVEVFTDPRCILQLLQVGGEHLLQKYHNRRLGRGDEGGEVSEGSGHSFRSEGKHEVDVPCYQGEGWGG